jgi:RND superfamily putative drug exporter
MSRFLHHLGYSTAAHPWRTISAWLVVAVAFVGFAGAFGGTPQDNWNIADAPAQTGIAQLREHTPGAGNAGARVVVHNRVGSPVDASVIDPLTTRLRAMDHTVAVSPPQLSADKDTALLTVQYDAPVTDRT